MTPAAATLYNVAAFQLGWFACVLGGNFPGAVATVAVLGVHLRWLAHPGEWRVLAGFALLGLVVDGGLALAGGFAFTGAAWPIPLWLWLLWPLFATLAGHSLAWLWRHPWLATACGASGGALSYWGGARLAGVELAPWLLPAEALAWGLICRGCARKRRIRRSARR